MLELFAFRDEPALCRNSPLGIMITSCAAICQTDKDYYRIYRQEETAVLLQNGSSAVLCADDHADLEEIKHFVDFLGCDTILCENPQLEDDETVPVNSGLIMSGEFENRTDRVPAPQTTDEYKSIYRLIRPENVTFSDWFSDINLRIRRGTAELAAVFENGEAVAAAGILHRTENRCMLGAVVTGESHRRQGLASGLIRRLSTQTTVLLCLPELEEFYRRLGFERCGSWYEYKRKQRGQI